MKDKIIKISYSDKPEVCKGKDPISFAAEWIEMMEMEFLKHHQEMFDLCMPKINHKFPVGKIMIMGTGGEIDNNENWLHKEGL